MTNSPSIAETEGVRHPRKPRRNRRLERLVPPIAALIVLIAVWWILTVADTTRARVIPRPDEVIQSLIRFQEVLITRHIPITLLEAVLGLILALILGVILAGALDRYSLLKRAVYPLLIASQTIPIVAIAPVLILIFGFGIEPKIVVVVSFCFFPITVATVDGLAATDPDYVALLRAMGATRHKIWRMVRMPSALPSLFSGLRIAAAYSIGGAVVGEYVTAQYGLGMFLRQAFNSGKIDQGFAAVVIITILSIGLVILVGLIEHLALPWYYTPAREWEEPGIY